MGQKHYIAGSGSYGCLYDCCTVHETESEAISALMERFELTGKRWASLLSEAAYADLPRDAGADYCEIVECNCDNPSQHEDA